MKSAGWNPWHGCTKLSEGCRYCYVYRQDERYGAGESRLCRKTSAFSLPVRTKRGGGFAIPSGTLVYTCFTSDFLLADADAWRAECWRMMKQRSDCSFMFFTKRIDRLEQCLPSDWGDGYNNVVIGCTVENQDRADYRLEIFRRLPIKHKLIICAPLLGRIDLARFLDGGIEEVSVGGESGQNARPCDFEWVLDIRRQCEQTGTPFLFHQTGANFIKDGRRYFIPRRMQHEQARRAGIDLQIGADRLPLSAALPEDPEQLTLDE